MFLSVAEKLLTPPPFPQGTKAVEIMTGLSFVEN